MKSPAAGSQREPQIKYQQGINYGSRSPYMALYMTRLLYTWIYMCDNLPFTLLVSVSRGFREYGGQRLIRLEHRTAIVADAGEWH